MQTKTNVAKLVLGSALAAGVIGLSGCAGKCGSGKCGAGKCGQAKNSTTVVTSKLVQKS